ncbi:MAG TPA: TolC family protein [Thermoanaerobaculia bacterium]|jgi:outer membrane protein TolC|nr:TolC family protein [Thermoanaerobaculia bacterium]
MFVLLVAFGGLVALAEDAPSGGLALMDAVRLTLANDPNVAIEAARVDSARGALQIASGRFDPVVVSGLTQTSSKEPRFLSSSQETRTLQSTLGVSQEFRNGLILEPQLQLDRAQDVTAGSGALNTGTVRFQLRQPLLRGRGRAAVQAEELAAEREVVASGFDLRHTVAQRLRVVVAQYWQVRAAEHNLDVLRVNERSSRDLLDNTRKLIQADQVPAADLVQLEANLAAAESARIGGERDLFAQRQDLGREIGLGPSEIATLPLPSDPFPSLGPEQVPANTEARGFIELALRHRSDLEAARQRETELDLQRKAAENALKPQLDLILAPNYSGIAAGGGASDFLSPLYRNVPGAGALASLALSWPTRNQRARGALLQIDAARRQSALAIDLVAKGIGADVPAALDAVGRDALRLERARAAVRLFERTVGNEEKKLRGGTSTLLDLISQRDRLIAARQTEVAAELALALSLLELRFQTGTLLGEGGMTGEVEVSRLITLPSPREGAR